MLVGGASSSGLDSNVVPASAWFSVERRFNPEETLADVRGELETIVERHRANGVTVEVATLQESEACLSPADTPVGRALATAVQEVTGRPPRFELCPGVLETRFFCQRGIPGYGYGPGLLAVSHGAEEYVGVQELLDCTTAYALTAARLLE
jgi:acetylornithine deacetylase/succinyl-diaminopimelate desuccinylase-like protein